MWPLEREQENRQRDRLPEVVDRVRCQCTPSRASKKETAVKVNVFAGARRTALVIGSFWVLGCVAFAVFTEPYSQVTYAILKPGDTPVLAEGCEGEEANIHPKMPTGHSINVRLCFPTLTEQEEFEVRARLERKASQSPVAPTSSTTSSAMPQSDPNKIDPNEVEWDSGGPRSVEIAAYKNAPGRLLLPGVIEAAEAKEKAALLAQWKDAMLVLFGGLAAGWVFVAAIGWIARGFMGIPMGKDMRA